jgi:hypothetical protein
MRFVLAVLLFALAAPATRAGTITAEFEGTLTLASGVEGADMGTPFSGSFRYDDGAALQMLDADSGLYDFAGFPTTGFHLVIHTPTPVEFSGAPLRDITIDDTAGYDALAVVATNGPMEGFRLDLMGGTDLVSSLQLTIPDLAQGSGELQYTNFGAGMVMLMGTLTSLAVVPEPSSSALLGLVFTILAGARMRSRG